jgi:hypothetical protein
MGRNKRRTNMRQTMRVLLAIFVLTSISAFAGSFTNLGVNFNIQPNNGSGGNIGGAILGPGVNLLAGGGTDFSWFNDLGPGAAPGSTGGGGMIIFWDGAIGQIGSQNYTDFGCFNFPCIALDPVVLNAGSFTFPTNGQDFTITVPASLGVITGTIVSDCNVCQTFTLTTNPGTLTLSFFYSSYWGQYFGSSGSFTSAGGAFTTTPEPGTLGLVAIDIVAVARRRLHQKRG